ncbi:MAG: ATP-binding cassette domain-containing protein, partial [Bacteroidales bacterium]|nr:ATP-binding cassette domain-containing protein [Bacteroidales bacterium]
MIQVNNLNKYFGEKHVLKDISITYKPGECSLIIGASGSGKTVFLKSLVGLLTPDSGEIWYEKIQFNALSFKEQRSIRKE